MIEMSTIHFWSFAGRRVDLYANFHSFPSFRERFVVCLDAGNDPNVYKLKNKKKKTFTNLQSRLCSIIGMRALKE